MCDNLEHTDLELLIIINLNRLGNRRIFSNFHKHLFLNLPSSV